ncbi:isochorismatase family protein [Vibrio sp. PP-XX7]
MKFTALDAADLGFRTWVIQDALPWCRYLSRRCRTQAYQDMENAGCHLIQSQSLLESV